MKFQISRSSLLEGLQAVQNVVNIRSTLPILANVHIIAEKETVYLTTTDLEVSVRCTLEAEVSKTGGTTIPVRRLSSIVRELADDTVILDSDDKDVTTLTCGSSFFKIVGLSEDEFPPFPKAESKHTYRFDQNTFREMLRKTAYAASSDETRYVLNGVLLSFKDGKLTMVATDGRRLALVEQEVDIPAEAETEMILPSKAVNELLHVLGDENDLSLASRDSQIIFEFNNLLLASKLIKGNYPNYRQVIPSECEQRVTIERESLLTALRRVSLVTTDRSNATKLTFAKNQVVLTMNTPDIGEARETIPVKYGGPEVSVAFNPDFMMDPLKNLDNDEIFIEFTDELSPGVIKCEIPFIYVLMPMRIS